MYRANMAENRSVLVAAFSGKIFGVDRATGQTRWAVELEAYGGEVEIAS